MKNPIQRRIAKYETVLAHSVWKKTPLLKIFSERLRQMLKRLKAAHAMDKGQDQYVSVYVLLYHQQGELTVWEDMLKKVKYSVERRPIYLTLQEAQHAIVDKRREGIVLMDMPKVSVMGIDGSRYLKVEDVKLQNVKGFYWDGKLFHFNELSLIEMNSELTD